MLDLNTEALEAELEKALRDEPHNLKTAIVNLSACAKQYKTEVDELIEANTTLGVNAKNLEVANGHLTAVVKEMYIVLNADLEIALNIKGMEKMLEAMANFVVGSGAIKAGVVEHARAMD